MTLPNSNLMKGETTGMRSEAGWSDIFVATKMHRNADAA